MDFARAVAEIFARHLRDTLRFTRDSLVQCFQEIVRLVQDHAYDERLGIRTCYDHAEMEERSLYRDEIVYKPTPYRRIVEMLDTLKLGPADVFVDLGCGKGRVLAMVSGRGVRKVIGVEVKQSLAALAEENLARVRSERSPFAVFRGDAATFDVREGTVFFFYDPFRYQTFSRVIGNIRDSLASHPRRVRIVYHNGRYEEVLDAADWLVRVGDIGRTRISVWSSKPQSLS